MNRKHLSPESLKELDFSQEVSSYFESMILPNRYLYKELHLVPNSDSRRAPTVPEIDFSLFGQFSNQSSSTNGSSIRTSSSSKTDEVDFDDLVIKHKFRSLSIDDSRQKAYNGFFDHISSEKSLFSRDWNIPFHDNDELKTPSKKSYPSANPGSLFEHPEFEENLEIIDEQYISLDGKVLSLSQTQKGCRYLQKMLNEDKAVYKVIFDELYPEFVNLITDPFGNYLCQKLYEVSPHFERNLLMNVLESNAPLIAMNVHGTRALQKIIECSAESKEEDVSIIVFALKSNVVDLIIDTNGNHVIQKCLTKLTAPTNQFIYNEIAENCVAIATHRHGCCVIQRALDYATNSLASRIIANSLRLIQDPYGNYVIQYVLDLGNPDYVDYTVKTLLKYVCYLSKQKFSSNAIEKIIRVSSPSDRLLLVNEILKNGNAESMVCDSYANYVVQTAIDFADPVQRRQLINHVLPKLKEIKNSPFAKKLLAKIQVLEPEMVFTEFK